MPEVSDRVSPRSVELVTSPRDPLVELATTAVLYISDAMRDTTAMRQI